MLRRWSSAGPSAWGLLKDLHLDANLLSGTLPDTWGSGGSFPAIANITLAGNNLSGSIPASWGTDANGKTAFRRLPVVTLRPGETPHHTTSASRLVAIACAIEKAQPCFKQA